MGTGEGRAPTYLWSEELAAVCVVASCSLVRSDCTEIGRFEINSLNFSRSSCSSRVWGSRSQSVEASGSKQVLSRVLSQWAEFLALAAVSVPPFAADWWTGWGCLAGRVLTQHQPSVSVCFLLLL